MRQSRKTYSLSLKYSSSLKLYALRFMTLILLFIPSTLPVDIWQSYHASIPLLYASIPLLYIQGCKAPMHDIENCCSLLYICLWLFKYTKCSAVFFRSIQTLSLHFPDEPKIYPNRLERGGGAKQSGLHVCHTLQGRRKYQCNVYSGVLWELIVTLIRYGETLAQWKFSGDIFFIS